MNRIIRTILIFHCLVAGALVHGQQFMLVENRASLRNFKYYEGDLIRLKVDSEQRIIEGEITGLSDSSVFIGSWEEVPFKDIRYIYRERFGIALTRGFLLVAGIGYFSIDSFNRLINNDAPVILVESLAIGAGLVGLNFLLIPLKYKRISPDKWEISTIDFLDLDIYRITSP